jgi:two-component system sensor histidine kinase KdpD
MNVENGPVKRKETVTQALSRISKAVVIAVVVAASLAYFLAPFHAQIDQANSVMLFLLSTFLIAINFGKDAAISSALMNVIFFDYYFVSPRFSFAVDDVQYVITLVVMLTIGLVTGQLVAGLKEKITDVSFRVTQSNALQRVSQKLITLKDQASVVQAAIDLLAKEINVEMKYISGQEKKEIDSKLHIDEVSANSLFVLKESVFQDHGEFSFSRMMIPIMSAERVIGILIATDYTSSLSSFGRDEVLKTAANLIGMALTQLELEVLEQQNTLKIESEKLKNAVLTSLSHDLRTPLTSIIGLTESLQEKKLLSSLEDQQSLDQIRLQGIRLSSMISNLLELVRLQKQTLTLHKELQPIEEVVGASVQTFQSTFRNRVVEIITEQDIPPVQIDEILIDRVLANLLENAAKYSEINTPITIKILTQDPFLIIKISDQGIGFKDDPMALFQMFVRGDSSQKNGIGLGLYICQTIIRAHKGEIRIYPNALSIGSTVEIQLPLNQFELSTS